MHQEVEDFFSFLKNDFRDLFVGKKVLEFGSLDINGSVRKYFTNCDYTGLDWRPGPGVDVVSLMHKYQSHPVYDVVVTTSALEHDPYWRDSLLNCCDILKDGGSLIITCGGPTYEEHCIETSPPKGEDHPGGGHYAGVGSEDISNLLVGKFLEYLDESDSRDVRMLFIGKK